MDQKISVIGGGSWATAIVKILSNNVSKIHWWVRSNETAEFIRKYKHNPNYLSDVEIDLSKIEIETDLKKAITSSDLIILAVPSAFLKNTLEKITSDDLKGRAVFSAIKRKLPF